MQYKTQKKITLDDNITLGEDDNNKNNDDNDKGKLPKGDGSVQNFIKDAIPYAQDATRKTHYKKLLRYLRVVDY